MWTCYENYLAFHSLTAVYNKRAKGKVKDQKSPEPEYLHMFLLCRPSYSNIFRLWHNQHPKGIAVGPMPDFVASASIVVINFESHWLMTPVLLLYIYPFVFSISFVSQIAEEFNDLIDLGGIAFEFL